MQIQTRSFWCWDVLEYWSNCHYSVSKINPRTQPACPWSVSSGYWRELMRSVVVVRIRKVHQNTPTMKTKHRRTANFGWYWARTKTATATAQQSSRKRWSKCHCQCHNWRWRVFFHKKFPEANVNRTVQLHSIKLFTHFLFLHKLGHNQNVSGDSWTKKWRRPFFCARVWQFFAAKSTLLKAATTHNQHQSPSAWPLHRS